MDKLCLTLSRDEAAVLRDLVGDVPVSAPWQRRVVADDVLARLNRMLAAEHRRSARRRERIEDRQSLDSRA